ncbi:hypothetical protein IJJ18_02625 [Candidatus Saccharibacteria bacterium]|nr:hypothetical protein [Candidatus Saccharibacteria bacterium]
MSEKINYKQKGEDLEYELFGGSELSEAKYIPKKEVSEESRERALNWVKKKKIKLGKAALFAFGEA